MPFTITDLPLLAGQIGICPMPGRTGQYQADLAQIIRWSPDLVLTMTALDELATKGAVGLPADLARRGIAWRHLPIADFGSPDAQTAAAWPKASDQARAILGRGGRVLAHCMGGCGRSGMALLRLMVETGEDPALALARLRAARPCAVETREQQRWASAAATSGRA